MSIVWYGFVFFVVLGGIFLGTWLSAEMIECAIKAYRVHGTPYVDGVVGGLAVAALGSTCIAGLILGVML